MPTFADRLKELRISQKLTQKQMAENLGITERNYQRYEATSNPSVKTLIKIADYFDVTIDYLLGRSDK